jgi:hypothetical protein
MRFKYLRQHYYRAFSVPVVLIFGGLLISASLAGTVFNKRLESNYQEIVNKNNQNQTAITGIEFGQSIDSKQITELKDLFTSLSDKEDGLQLSSHDSLTLGTSSGLSLSGQALSLGLSSTSSTGALSSSDWRLFNSKQPAGLYLTADSVHDSLTLGTSSGLSLSGQALSLGLSSTSSTGALSSSDWSIFNSKLSSELATLALVTGRGASTSTESTFSSGLVTSKIRPEADSTTAFQINKADGISNVLNVDTTNGYVGIGTTSPTAMLTIKGVTTEAVIGSELITNLADRDFSADTGNWTGTNWAVSGSKENHSVSGADVLTLNSAALTTAPIAGKTYQISFTAVTSAATEMIVAAADRDFSSDTGKWTGVGWTIAGNVNTHVAGANAVTLDNTALTLAPISGHKYQVTFTAVTTTAGTLTPNIGGANGSPIGHYAGTTTQTQAITASGTGALIFTPSATWAGTIDAVSVKDVSYGSITPTIGSVSGVPIGQTAGTYGDIQVITATTSDPLTFVPSATWTGTLDSISVKQITTTASIGNLLNSSGVLGVEMRSGGASGGSTLGNTFIGEGVGLSATTSATQSVGIGYQALKGLTTGIRATAVGYQAMFNNTSGTLNSAFGFKALYANTTGSRNGAFGYYALTGNTTGSYNTAIGSWNAMPMNRTGNNNTAVGYTSLYNNTVGSDNTAVGLQSVNGNITGIGNTGVGLNALQFNSSGNYNVAMGWAALNNVSGSNNIGIGYAAGTGGTYSNSKINNDIIIGYKAGYGLIAGADNNILIGYQAADALTSGNNNIIIGHDIDAPAVTTSNSLDIGNLLYGTGLTSTGTSISTGNLGIAVTSPAARLHLPAGTAAVSTAPLKFTTGTLLATEEAGAIEFVGDTFYMTATGGVAGSTQRQAIPGVTTGTAAPITTPVRVGDIYVDTTNHKIYMSDGTVNSANWLLIN